jgi:hypothetical protein
LRPYCGRHLHGDTAAVSPKVDSMYSDRDTKILSSIKKQEARLGSNEILADLDTGLLLYIIYIQGVPFKSGPLARRNQERILFRLVFGILNAHSYRRCSKLYPFESIHFCERVIKFLS